MKSRKFAQDILHHCYQRSADGGVLFYDFMDHLVYFTLYCTLAREYDINVLAACQMPDHVHDSVRTSRKENLVRFKRTLNARFAKQYNTCCSINGPVFESPFGSAPKYEEKKIRTNLIYVWNNPVERKLVQQAEEYRWNFLAYAISPHPFSKEIVIRRASKVLLSAIKIVKAEHAAGRPMNYTLIKNLTRLLSQEELEQFIDLVISTYNVIDYQAASRYFGSYAALLVATHSTTGSEYDLNETFVGRSDKPYAEMTQILMEECGYNDIHEMLSLDNDAKRELFDILRRQTFVMAKQIAKFLHLPIIRV